MICERCEKETKVFSMSMFNMQHICMECQQKEESHPRYKEAAEAERQASLNGDYNFPGIGLPEDLQ